MTTTEQTALVALILPATTPPTLNIVLAKSIKVAFPECTDILLSQTWDTTSTVSPADASINAIYKEYFSHQSHIIFNNVDDKHKLACPSVGKVQVNEPCTCCLPDNCTTLRGRRGTVQWAPPTQYLNRIFIADKLWAYWMEEMGILRVFAKIINDYAIKGEFPLETNIEIDTPDLTPMIMEAMTRQMKSGLASSIKDRVSTYRRSLGWTTALGRQSQMDTIINNSFHDNFHRFIKSSLDYYEQQRLATAIQGASAGHASISTIVDITTALELLQKASNAFNYGRNYNNTLNTIVYLIASLDLIRNVKEQLGIPNDDIKEYVSAAYNILIEGKSLSESNSERYILYKRLADNGRDLMLDIQYLSLGSVKDWIENDEVETRIESYRSAYQKLFGIDLFKTIDNLPQKA